MAGSKSKAANYLKENPAFFLYIIVMVIGVLTRMPFMNVKTYDYKAYLYPWLKELRENGGLAALGLDIGEYNIPYMAILAVISMLDPEYWLWDVKIISIIFDCVGAFTLAGIATKAAGKPYVSIEGLMAFTLGMMNPAAFLNSAAWGQCDSIYFAFIALSLLCLMYDKPNMSMIFYGLSISMKLQAVLFFPVLFIAYAVNKKIKFRQFFIIPLVYIICVIPALISGRSVESVAGIYFAQTGLYSELTLNCPTIYSFANVLALDNDNIRKVGIIGAAIIALACAGMFIYKFRYKIRKAISDRRMVMLAVWMTMLCVFVLPSMHERYTYVPCMLSIAWAAICRKDWYIAAIINATTLFTYIMYLTDMEADLRLLTVSNFIAIMLMMWRVFYYDDGPAEIGETVGGESAEITQGG